MNEATEYLADERLDSVALYLIHGYLDGQGKLPNMGIEVDNGYVPVVPGDNGHHAFTAGTGMDAMESIQTAMDSGGGIDDDLSGGTCPEAATEENHEVRFIFSFIEAQNGEVGDIYEEGSVAHVHAKRTCGTTYLDHWAAGDV